MDKIVLDILRDPFTIKMGSLLILFLSVYFIVRLLKKGVLKYAKDNESKYRFGKIFNLFGYVIFFIGLLLIFNNRLTGFGTALGVTGAGIAFALQEVIASIAGYIAVFSSNFYKVGDRVQLGGIKGDVVDIGLLRTTLMEIGDWVDGDLYNGKMVRVANSFVFKEPVYNYSGDFPFLWDEIKIPIKHKSDYDFANELFLKILVEEVGSYAEESQIAWNQMIGDYRLENARIQPLVSMSFNENWITFTLRYVVDYKARRVTKSALFKKIMTEIRNSGGKIEVASSSLEIVNVSTN